ncbi:polyprotein [Murre virus]|uniref:Envelopment polyprotein n=1 Tax=Murre virus TaxID=1010668 RepID=L7NZH5_9VIRU|nr:polyprotein [Murre virus]AFH08737.1 polyprotein [Murre virus]
MVKPIVLVVLFACAARAIFNNAWDVSRRLHDSTADTWKRDQPSSHTLVKSLDNMMTSLTIPMNNKTISTNHSTHLRNYRVYNCGTGRNSITMLDLKSGNFTKLKCRDNETLSPDCSTCTSKAPNFMMSKDLAYDDVVCQSDYSPTEALPDHSTKICKVGPLHISECKNEQKSVQHVSWFWINGKVRIFDDYTISWQEGKFISLFDCTNSTSNQSPCNKSVCLSGSCSGDVHFCTEFSCKSDSPVCSCSRNEVPGIAIIHTRLGSFMPACFGKSLWAVSKSRSKRSATVQQECVDCETTCNPDAIYVVVRHFSPGHYRACLGSTCLTGIAHSKEFQIPFKIADRLSDSDLEIRIWDSHRHNEYFITSKCKSVDACAAINCWFCRANWANIHCFSKEQTLILIIILSICVVLIASVLKAIKVIISIIWKVLKPIIWLVRVLSKAASRVASRRAASLRDSVNSLEEGLLNPPQPAIEQRAAVPARANDRLRMFRLSRMTILSICCILLISYSEQCSDSISVTAPSHRCTTDSNGSSQCQVSTSSILQVSPKGQESCLILKNPNGLAVDTIKIRTKEIKLECIKRDLYWAPRVTHRCIGVRRCHLMGECKGDKCSEFKLDSYSPEWGHKDELMSQLGWSYCVEQCGGALCQCFNLNPSCFYLRKTFSLLSQDAYNMFECSEWAYKIDVVVVTNTSETNVTLKLGVPDSIPHGVISLSTVSQPPTVAYGECFGEDVHGVKFHAECNRRTDYSLGKIGEIQCPTKADALSVSKSCISSESIIHSRVHKDVVDCSSSIIDPSIIKKKNQLPSTVGTVTFWPTENSVEASIPELASALMLVRLDGFTFTYKSDNNKCNARFLSLSGCYNCEPGAKLEIEHVTDFGTALGLLSCPEIGYTTYFDVKTTLEKTVRTIHVNNSHIDITCHFKCPNSDMTLRVKGELVYLFNDDVRHSNQTLTPGLSPKLGMGWDPFGWFRASWLRLVWGLLGGTISIVIGIIVVYMVWTACIKVKKQ